MNGRGVEAPQPLSSSMSTFWFLEAMQSGPQSQIITKGGGGGKEGSRE